MLEDDEDEVLGPASDIFSKSILLKRFFQIFDKIFDLFFAFQKCFYFHQFTLVWDLKTLVVVAQRKETVLVNVLLTFIRPKKG
jgi:hypothetical protein